MLEPQTQFERQVVGALILPPNAPSTDKTVPAVAQRTGLSERDVRRTLDQLAELDPPLVHADTDAILGIEFWRVINLDVHEGFLDDQSDRRNVRLSVYLRESEADGDRRELARLRSKCLEMAPALSR